MVHVLINNVAPNHCAHHVRYEKLLTVLEFDGASTVG